MAAICSRGMPEHARVEAHDHALVGVGVRDVEVVGLRARRRHVRADALPQLGLGARHQRVIVADADDLHGAVEHAAQIADHRRRELHRVLLVRDVGRGRVADEPVGAAVHPHVQARRQQVVRDLRRHGQRQRALLDHRREIRLDEHRRR